MSRNVLNVSPESKISEWSDSIEKSDKILQPISRIRYYDWNSAIQLVINAILQIESISSGSILFLDNINNCTNGSLNTDEIMEILHNHLVNNKKFTLISSQSLSSAKKQLGLSLQDNFRTYGKTIGIARSMGTQYTLYSNIIGNVNESSLQLQLLLVMTKSGEIIFSGKSIVQKQ